MSKRGSGSVYLRGNTYWIRYWFRGRDYRESAETDSETTARRFLAGRLRETGKRGAAFLGQAEDRVTFEDLAEMLKTDYAVNDRRSASRIDGALKHLREAFGLDRAVDITTDRIARYVTDRRLQSGANATINRELAALKRMFKLALHAERLTRAPHIAMLEENNARQGFVEHSEWQTLHDALPPHLQDPITFLYLSGWRVSEMRKLEWRDVDTAGQTIRLRPEISKNKEPRVLPLSGELSDVIARAAENRRMDVPFVFHDAGKPIAAFRRSWASACARAGLGPLLVHDLRRTAIRNLTRAGVPERIAMTISGHKTRAVFDRYNIVSESDLRNAVKQRDAYLESRPADRKVVPLR